MGRLSQPDLLQQAQHIPTVPALDDLSIRDEMAARGADRRLTIV
jgi:hypothetical protein